MGQIALFTQRHQAVATGEINGKKYMVALFQTTAVANPEYNKD